MNGIDDRGRAAPPIRLFILDDNEFVRLGLVALLGDLTNDVVVVGQASTADEGLRLMLELAPDVALLDVELPDGDGIAVCRNLRTHHPDAQCLMLTGHDEQEAMLAAVLAGASGYLSKQLPAAEILNAVRRAATGELLMDPVRAKDLLTRLPHPPAQSVGPGQPTAIAAAAPRLVEVERRILELVVERQTNGQIATQLAMRETAVKTRLSVIFIKIGLERRLSESSHHRRSA
jgi:two-component system response regulator DevR